MIVRTVPYADLLEEAGQGLVLYEGRLLRVSTLALATIELAAEGVHVDELALALERRFGLPEGSSVREATAAAVDGLIAQGVLVEAPMSRRWRINDDTAFVVSDPERVVLLNLAATAAQPIALLGTGSAVWRGLVGPEDDLRPWVEEAGLLAGLAESYGTETSAIAGDVTDLLARLALEGYVVSLDAGSASSGLTGTAEEPAGDTGVLR